MSAAHDEQKSCTLHGVIVYRKRPWKLCPFPGRAGGAAERPLASTQHTAPHTQAERAAAALITAQHERPGPAARPATPAVTADTGWAGQPSGRPGSAAEDRGAAGPRAGCRRAGVAVVGREESSAERGRAGAARRGPGRVRLLTPPRPRGRRRRRSRAPWAAGKTLSTRRRQLLPARQVQPTSPDIAQATGTSTAHLDPTQPTGPRTAHWGNRGCTTPGEDVLWRCGGNGDNQNQYRHCTREPEEHTAVLPLPKTPDVPADALMSPPRADGPDVAADGPDVAADGPDVAADDPDAAELSVGAAEREPGAGSRRRRRRRRPPGAVPLAARQSGPSGARRPQPRRMGAAEHDALFGALAARKFRQFSTCVNNGDRGGGEERLLVPRRTAPVPYRCGRPPVLVPVPVPVPQLGQGGGGDRAGVGAGASDARHRAAGH